jgi:hypothetical protein
MSLSLLLPLVQHVPELAASVSLCLSPVHQLVEPGSVFGQDHFPQLRQQGVLQREHESGKRTNGRKEKRKLGRSSEKIKRECNKN